VTEPTGLVDIVPTLIDLFDMDTEGTSPTDGISLAPFLDASRAESLESLQLELSNRALPFGHLMYAKERWAVVAPTLPKRCLPSRLETSAATPFFIGRFRLDGSIHSTFWMSSSFNRYSWFSRMSPVR